MTVEIDQLDLPRAEEVSDLHLQFMSGSLVGLMGRAFTARAYIEACKSDLETVIVRYEDDKVAGVVLLTYEPASYGRRLALNPNLFWRFLGGMIRPGRLLAVLKSLAEGGATVPDGVPEVVFIFTVPALRGRGLGTKLLQDVADVLVARGIREYYVTTGAAEDNLAIQFYLKNGFQTDSCFKPANSDVVLLRKRLDGWE